MIKRILSCIVIAALLLCVLPLTSVAANIVYGDVNESGAVDGVDAVLLKRWLAAWSVSISPVAADVDGNGTVDDLDSILLERYLAGWEVVLGPGEPEIVTVNGVELSEYRIVIPKEASLYELYAAVVLQDHLTDHYGLDLALVTDEEAESAYELLIGNTNRSATAACADLEFGELQYYIAAVTDQNGVKIVFLGDNMMVGGATSALINRYIVPAKKGQAVIPESVEAGIETFRFLPAQNVILMIGDGMGPNHVLLGEHGLSSGLAMEQEIDGSFVGRYFPAVGTCTTLNALGAITDSAAAATALSSGYKTINYAVGCDINGTAHKNVRELAIEAGAKTAIVTTDIATGATPSGFSLHVLDRHDTEEIQRQHDLMEIDYFAADMDNDLREETRAALRTISAGGSRFYMMVEEGMIDKAAGDETTSAIRCAEIGKYVVRMHDCAAYIAEFALMHPDTAFIITADHETGYVQYSYASKTQKYTFSISGNSHTKRDVPVFAMGAGTEIFNNVTTDNTVIGRFTAQVFGEMDFNADVPTAPAA